VKPTSPWNKGEFKQSEVAGAQTFLAQFDQVFAVIQDDDAAKLKALGFGSVEGELSDGDVEKLIAERNAARTRRDFATSDRVRKELADRGIILEDSRDGSVRWKRK